MRILRTLWEYLREASGEKDYARYRAHALARGLEPMSQDAFHLARWEHKYSRPSRCC
jgi:hypothetical protein